MCDFVDAVASAVAALAVRWGGRGASDYSDDELEQWRDVLYTLKHDELLPWERSIKKRGITMPCIIKEELVALALG